MRASLVILLSFVTLLVNAQKIERDKAIAAYLFNFTKHIDWPESESNFFVIHIISDNVKLKEELKSIEGSERIKEKSIQIKYNKPLPEKSSEIQMIFIGKDFHDKYVEIFDKYEGAAVLIVSENYNDEKLEMLNLYDADDGRLLFEINRLNIQGQGLIIDEKLLLMGGSVIDVTSLYMESQESLRSMQKRLNEYQAQLDRFNESINKSQKQIEEQNLTISSKNFEIELKKRELEDQLLTIGAQKTTVKDQKIVLARHKELLKKQISKIQETEQELNQQKISLKAGQQKFKVLQNEINEMDLILEQKTNELSKQGVTIDKQKTTIVLFIIISVLGIILAIVILFAYRANRKKSIALKINKETIESINEELASTNNNLLLTNEELNQKNDEILTTLETLRNTKDQLVQAEKMASLGILTAGIAHELNNPVNFIYAGVNSLIKDINDIGPVLEKINMLKSDSPDIVKSVREIEKLKEANQYEEAIQALTQTIKDIELGADRTVQIIRGLRNFSRLDQEEWQESNLHTIIADVLILLKNSYKNNVEIIKDFDEKIPDIQCYPGKINQVILNIISNAIDSIENKGVITIKTKKGIENATIWVTDTGKGMDDKTKSRIFDPFYTTKEVGKGTGLGMSITYGIIQEHRGTIDFNSELGKGTEITIQLPYNQNSNDGKS